MQEERGTGKKSLWGDCHIHSSLSDGLYTMAGQTPHLSSFGLDFRIQSDHFSVLIPDGLPGGVWLSSADWESYAAQCRKASTSGHLCLAGAEITWLAAQGQGGNKAKGWYHTKAYPAPGQPLPAEEKYARRTWPDTLQLLREAGCGVVIAHADQGSPLAQLSGDEIDGFEVRYDIEETRPLIGRESLRHWDRMLSSGRRVSISSGSDAHQPDQWAGSGLRTVLIDAKPREDSVREAVLAGRSYLSGTWHPDCYMRQGFPLRPNFVTGGETRFTPWWEFKRIPGFARRPPEEVAEEGCALALEHGRCRRADFPEIGDFAVDGAACGGETRAGKAKIRVRWKTHLPLSVLRLISQGKPVFELPASHPLMGVKGGEFHLETDLSGAHYVRLEIGAADPEDPAKAEFLLSNPIYLAS